MILSKPSPESAGVDDAVEPTKAWSAEVASATCIRWSVSSDNLWITCPTWRTAGERLWPAALVAALPLLLRGSTFSFIASSTFFSPPSLDILSIVGFRFLRDFPNFFLGLCFFPPRFKLPEMRTDLRPRRGFGRYFLTLSPTLSSTPTSSSELLLPSMSSKVTKELSAPALMLGKSSRVRPPLFLPLLSLGQQEINGHDPK